MIIKIKMFNLAAFHGTYWQSGKQQILLKPMQAPA
jgi:hypothetical protein